MKAVYAGSFDPFTLGHAYVLEQALSIFDSVIVIIANNPLKSRTTDVEGMRKMIIDSMKLPEADVIFYSGLVAQYCNENDIIWLVRGLRNTSDYMYEEEVAKINKEINPSLNTIYFRADNSVISSGMVRLLSSHGRDVAKYLPDGVEL
jgi:pantetheine-phosphate adenylyltransferase